MSGAVSAIGKTFSSVASGISTALGGAVKGVGAAVATGAAASSAGVSGIGSMVSGAGGILGNMFSGVTGVMTRGLGGLAETGVQAGSQLLGPATDAVTTGAVGGGMVAGGAGGAAIAPSFLSKAGNFLTSETGAGLIGGIGKGLMEYEKMGQEAEERQKDRDYLLAKEMRIRDSYDVPGSALPDGAGTGVVRDGQRPTPTAQFSRDFDMVYDPALGRIVRQARA